MTLVVGITGGIACGKTEVSKYLIKKGYLVFNSDLEVKNIKNNENFINKTKILFPRVIINNKIDNHLLLKEFMENDKKLKEFERIIHPLVFEKIEVFINENKDKPIVFLEIPLLYECNAENICNKVIVVYVEREIQEKRVLDRPNMTLEKKNFFLNEQMSLDEKRMKADYLVYSGNSFENMYKEIDNILEQLKV